MRLQTSNIFLLVISFSFISCAGKPGIVDNKYLQINGYGSARRSATTEKEMAKSAKAAAKLEAQLRAVNVLKGAEITCYDSACNSLSLESKGFFGIKGPVEFEKISRDFYRCKLFIDKKYFENWSNYHSFSFEYPGLKNAGKGPGLIQWRKKAKSEIFNKLVENFKRKNIKIKKQVILDHYYVYEEYLNDKIKITVVYSTAAMPQKKMK
jgi:hypothetical protein